MRKTTPRKDDLANLAHHLEVAADSFVLFQLAYPNATPAEQAEIRRLAQRAKRLIGDLLSLRLQLPDIDETEADRLR